MQKDAKCKKVQTGEKLSEKCNFKLERSDILWVLLSHFGLLIKRDKREDTVRWWGKSENRLTFCLRDTCNLLVHGVS